MTPTSPRSSVVNGPSASFVLEQPLSARNIISPQGVGVIPVHFPARPDRLVVPDFPEDHLVLHVTHPAKLQGKLVREFAVISQPGDMYIVPHGAATEWQNAGASDVLLLFLDHTRLTDMALAALDREPAQVNLAEQVAIPDPLVQAIGQALLHEGQSPGGSNRLYTEALLNTLLLHLLRRYMTTPQALPSCPGGLAPAALRRVLDYIREHLAHDLTIARLAQEANLSAYHFARLFKQSMGESLHQYVIRRRVAAAKELLLHETLTLPEVAAQVGFADQSHLGRHCKALLGVTPHRLAKERKNLLNPRKNLQDATA